MGDHFTRTFSLKLGPHEQGVFSNKRAYGFLLRILVGGVMVMEDGNKFGVSAIDDGRRLLRVLSVCGGEEGYQRAVVLSFKSRIGRG